jgi:hypothetical protein
VLSYPLLFVFERANVEAIVWAVLALGIAAFVARYHKAAGVLFALAASMKLFPALLLLLLLARKRYRELALSAAAIAVFTLIGLQVLGPSIPAAFQELRAGMDRQAAVYYSAYRAAEVGYDHSLFAIVKQLLYLQIGPDVALLDSRIRAASLPYMMFVVVGFAAVYWFWMRKLPLLNQAMALIILAVTLPFQSIEYTLNNVYFAWALFLLFLASDVTVGRESIPWPAAGVILACFAFVFALGPSSRYSGQLKVCALMVLLLLVLRVPMRSSLLDGNNHS